VPPRRSAPPRRGNLYILLPNRRLGATQQPDSRQAAA